MRQGALFPQGALMVQELFGHRNISTIQKYLGVNYADARGAVEVIVLITDSPCYNVKTTFKGDIP